MGRPSAVAFSSELKGASPSVLSTRARQSASVAGGKSPVRVGARGVTSGMAAKWSRKAPGVKFTHGQGGRVVPCAAFHYTS